MEPLAIVGIGCHFPGGVESLEGFWELLRNGVDAITDVPADRRTAAVFRVRSRYARQDLHAARRVREAANRRVRDRQFLRGISPREAAYLDPQQRLLLEITWEASREIRMAPAPGRLRHRRLHRGLRLRQPASRIPAGQPPPGQLTHRHRRTTLTIVANRLSHFFGFRGPSVALDTACSSSMVALHYACQSLRRRRVHPGRGGRRERNVPAGIPHTDEQGPLPVARLPLQVLRRAGERLRPGRGPASSC